MTQLCFIKVLKMTWWTDLGTYENALQIADPDVKTDF